MARLDRLEIVQEFALTSLVDRHSLTGQKSAPRHNGERQPERRFISHG